MTTRCSSTVFEPGRIQDEPPARSGCAARRIELAGGVQGLGVRPAIYRLARELGLAGRVQNTPGGVEIVVEGKLVQIDAFEQSLQQRLPAASNLSHVASNSVPESQLRQFEIVAEPH
jgi:hydrogenase maturation protein HypF